MRKFLAVLLTVAMASAQSAPPGYSVLNAPPLEVYAESTSSDEAQEVLDVLDDAVSRFSRHLPIGDDPVRIIVVATEAEFKRLAPGFSHLEVEGVAHSQEGWIVVKSRALHRPDSSFPGTLRHELVHVLLARNTAPGNLPRWLNEGAAMKLSGELQWSAPFRVARMQAAGDIIPYAHLDFAFSSDAETVGNAYAQALSMTEYLYDELGEESFWELVASLQHQSFGKAIQQYASMTPLGFWSAWRNSLWMVALVVSLMSGFTAFQVMALLVVLAYLRKRRHAKQRLAQWEREEAEEEDVFTVWDLEDQDPPYPWEDDEDERL